LLDLRTREVLWETESVPEHVAVAYDSTLLALAGSARVVLLDLSNMRVYASPLELKYPIACMAFSPKGMQLALQFWDQSVELRDIPDWELVRSFGDTWPANRYPIMHTRSVGIQAGVAFDPDRRWLASVWQGTVALWRVSNGELTRRLGETTRELSSLAFAPDGITVASGCRGGRVLVHRIANGELAQSFTIQKAPKLAVGDLAFSPSGAVLAATGVTPPAQSRSDPKVPKKHIIRLWSLSTGRTWRVIRGHTDSINGFAFIDDGKALVSAGSDGMVHIARLV
jgi:WD40 repeat protein